MIYGAIPPIDNFLQVDGKLVVFGGSYFVGDVITLLYKYIFNVVLRENLRI